MLRASQKFAIGKHPTRLTGEISALACRCDCADGLDRVRHAHRAGHWKGKEIRMKNIVIVVTDQGNFKAFKLERTEMNTPRLTLLEEFLPVNGHGKLLDKVSDQAGRYHNTGHGKWATPWGEPHNIELEQRKRLIRQLADELQNVLGSSDIDGCYFAASKDVHNQILDALPRESRAKILKDVSADLTKVDKSELLQHFGVSA
jgi:hypothetical protein